MEQTKQNHKIFDAMRSAFPHTLPILTGFFFLGLTYGFLMQNAGFPPSYPTLLSIFVFAGSLQFAAIPLLAGPFQPLHVLSMALLLQARHVFYGMALLEKYKHTGKKKWYLIFGLCDETFAINSTVTPEKNIDAGWFYFFVTVYNQLYWVGATALGAYVGRLITINAEGLDFVMTAMFVVLFLEQWLKEKNHTATLIGIGASVLSLLLFGAEHFLIAAMILISGLLLALRNPIEHAEKEAAR